ncbi:DUF6214 family protein [Mycobacterium paraseoulense]|uniref:Uncharacterized protein n=1 Tax=Mycobacterium paraseoulense TaxID=590652 RepID=A0A1X0I9J9_9MYCO|nr:DUF6214 family protein [Mycobacterium paraseoulense]MCV7394372.1 hypothetical protein [Mycobacterium paraseoulense]ORB40259.1 hypothetical protein BST39_14310 [Mycobacterium paraseoulense]BBZ74138.1 hypothetical protein MPRS_52310 [Mycobacterium paraseoulense]
MAFEKVKLVYELRDGQVEVTDDTIVPIGDVYTYRQLTYTSDTATIVFEVRGGVPGCVSVELRSGERPILAKDLVAIKLDQLRDEAFLVVGMIIPDTEGGHDAIHRVARKTLDRMTSRRKITPEFLARVAEIHRAAPEGGRLAAVTAAFGASERQAWRYIAQAREAGLINE